jgi:hypothetical protein
VGYKQGEKGAQCAWQPVRFSDGRSVMRTV